MALLFYICCLIARHLANKDSAPAALKAVLGDCD
jgi:hypothetical protein